MTGIFFLIICKYFETYILPDNIRDNYLNLTVSFKRFEGEIARKVSKSGSGWTR